MLQESVAESFQQLTAEISRFARLIPGNSHDQKSLFKRWKPNFISKLSFKSGFIIFGQVKLILS